MSPLKKLALGAALVIASPCPGRADTLWIKETPTAKQIKVDGVKVSEFKDDRLYFTEPGNTLPNSKTLTQLVQMNIDGETAFNSAENAYGSNDLDTAINGYQTVLQANTAKPWMLSRAALRLIAAAKVKNRYDAEVTAYCNLLLKDPTTAAANKPGTPPENSQYLDTALTAVTKTLGSSQLTAPQKSSLLGLELDLDRAKGDKSGANATLQQLVALDGAAASDKDKAMLKVAQAGIELDAKHYTQALNLIEQNKTMFSDPDQQVDALYVLAQAHAGIDGDKNDPDKLKDLAIDYLRVVTFGDKLKTRAHVADSLLAAAEISEKMHDRAAATALYQQLLDKTRGFPGTPAAAKAQTALAQLGK